MDSCFPVDRRAQTRVGFATHRDSVSSPEEAGNEFSEHGQLVGKQQFQTRVSRETGLALSPLVKISRTVCRRIDKLRFGAPITHVYNPLVYARAPHEEYLERYGRRNCEVLLIGMNPGPWGMAQTGVPFGSVALVRDWLGIEKPVKQPPTLHPKRPIEGFACTRQEVSGKRLWGWASQRFETPAIFAKKFFIWNYCPLIFYDEAGRNLTPDKLRATEKSELFEACDWGLRKMAEHLGPRQAIGVGKFAEDRARAAFADAPWKVGRILHPSPASPLANRGWAEQAEKQLIHLGVKLG